MHDPLDPVGVAEGSTLDDLVAGVGNGLVARLDELLHCVLAPRDVSCGDVLEFDVIGHPMHDLHRIALVPRREIALNPVVAHAPSQSLTFRWPVRVSHGGTKVGRAGPQPFDALWSPRSCGTNQHVLGSAPQELGQSLGAGAKRANLWRRPRLSPICGRRLGPDIAAGQLPLELRNRAGASGGQAGECDGDPRPPAPSEMDGRVAHEALCCAGKLQGGHMGKIDVSSYVVTDDFFGAPYIDIDEERTDPIPHRYVHGGFEGTTTRFAMWFPPQEEWHGRMYQPLEGANAGHEDVFASPIGADIGGLVMTLNRLGGYMIESNMGHIGDVLDPKAGEDPTVYGWRAAAESGRLSKLVAEQVLGSSPSYSYVWGGSGGARRSPLCLAYAPDVWDAALPFMGDAQDGEFGNWERLRGCAQHFCAMFNVQRVLGDKIDDVVDAVAPGGSGDPFVGLNTHQREELANLYRLGYPRGDEAIIAPPHGTIWLWTSMADRIQKEHPDYWEAFWTKPGHVGFDQPELVTGDLIDMRGTVARSLFAKDFMEDPLFKNAEFDPIRRMASLFAAMHNTWDVPMAIEIDRPLTG